MSHVSEEPATGVLDDVDLYTRIYRQMLLIRGFEDLVQSLFLAGEVYGRHISTPGRRRSRRVSRAFSKSATVSATYRGHGHALAVGVDPQALLDEMLGRESGVNGGRAGSMNINSPGDRLIGSFGIVGGSIRRDRGGAGTQADDWRCRGGVLRRRRDEPGLRLRVPQLRAGLPLPIVLVCENNGYGEYTPFRSVTAGEIRARAEVMGVTAETIDGMSVWTVREAARRAVAHARAGDGPVFVEALTYRFVGHSRSDPGAYRPDGELEEWRARDPMVVLRTQLEAEGVDAGDLDEVEPEMSAQLERMRERGSPRLSRRSYVHASSRTDAPCRPAS